MGGMGQGCHWSALCDLSKSLPMDAKLLREENWTPEMWDRGLCRAGRQDQGWEVFKLPGLIFVQSIKPRELCLGNFRAPIAQNPTGLGANGGLGPGF